MTYFCPQKVLVVFLLLHEEQWYILSDLDVRVVRLLSLQVKENLIQVCFNNRYLLALRSLDTEADQGWFGEAGDDLDPMLSILSDPWLKVVCRSLQPCLDIQNTHTYTQ